MHFGRFEAIQEPQHFARRADFVKALVVEQRVIQREDL